MSDMLYGLIAELAKAFRAIGSGFRQAWDNLSISIFLSIIWCVLGFGPFGLAVVAFLNISTYYMENTPELILVGNFIGYLIVVVVTSLLVAPITTATYATAHLIHSERDANIKDFFRQLLKHYKRSVGFTFFTMMVLAILHLNSVYYMAGGTFSNVIGIFMVVLAAFLLVSIQYMFPFAVQQDIGVWKIIKKSVLLSMDNVTVTIVLTVFGLLFFYISFYTALPLAVLFMGVMSAVHNLALVELLKKYDGPPPGSD